MKPLRICLENFKSHRYSDIDCTLFNSVLIVGKDKNNEDESNGTGKTSIFEAVAYALYKVYPTKTIDKIVRRGSNKCIVTFEFEVNQVTYKIVRSYTRSSAKSDLTLYKFENGEYQKITHKTPTETELELLSIIKIPYYAFSNCILFAQSDLNGLSGLASQEKSGRRKILKESLDLGIYNKLEKIAKEQFGIISDKLLTCSTLISSLGSPDLDISSINTKLSQIKEIISQKNEELSHSQISLDQNKFKLNDLVRASSSESLSFQDKLVEIQSNKRTLINNIATLDRTLKEKESQRQSSLDSLNSELMYLTDMSSTLENLLLSPIRSIDEISSDIEKHTTNESNGKSKLHSLESDCEKLQRPLPDGNKCPHCRQVMTEDHKIQCAKDTAEQVAKIEEEISFVRSKLKIVTAKKIAAINELSEANALSFRIKSLKGDIENKKIKIQHSQDFIKQIDELTNHTKLQFSTAEKKLEEINKRELSVKQSLKNINEEDVSDKISNVRLEISKLEALIRNISNTIASESTNVGILTEKLENRIKDSNKLNELNKELEILERSKRITQMVVHSFTSSGIPTMIINTVLDDLQVECNNLLNELRPGLELQFSIIKNKSDGSQEDTLDISYRLDGSELDYEMLSGGQKLLVALGLKLGLSLVIQHRFGVDIKMLQLDEVAQSLDKARTESFARAIKKWQDRFKIFIITHNDRLKDKFSHAILVESDGDSGTTAKVVTSW